MSEKSSPLAPSLQHLRSVAALQGVHPEDADLEATLGFLNAILPALADLERRLALDPGLLPEEEEELR